jgi:hypothetical protein
LILDEEIGNGELHIPGCHLKAPLTAELFVSVRNSFFAALVAL